MITGKRGNTITLEGNRIMWRNFSGEKSQFHTRSFSVEIAPEDIDDLVAEGWPITVLEPRQNGDPVRGAMFVTLYYNDYPPMVVVVGPDKKTKYDEKRVGDLDQLAFEKVSMRVSLGKPGRTGKRTVYLQSLWATLRRDDFEAQFDNIPWSDMGE